MPFRLLRELGLAILAVGLTLSARAQIVAVGDGAKQVFINVTPEELKGLLRTEKSRVIAISAYPSLRSVPRPRFLGADVEELVAETARRYEVDPALVRAIIQVESSGNQWAVSHKGAIGLMQVVPETGRQLGANNLFDPQENVEAGVKYLKQLLDSYRGNLHLSLAAYNAGPKAVERHGGVPPYRETQQYVRRVTDVYFSPASGSGYSDSLLGARRRIYVQADEMGRAVYRND
jgi:soluble lytic murein transglycosylase-like protein